MNRRRFLKTATAALPAALAPTLMDQLFAAGGPPVWITKVEPIVIRTPAAEDVKFVAAAKGSE